ncbi:hypothetical protein PISMIDRAFT_191175 [Pisolithus microcarpus 441]|uniref:Uncharacterized protein n=1 Tax=Pisolithus microcarpus 441 TaxID=765257 RepID=A0A0C9YWM7_9AGAM|nr:hypothetical protein PISMIDRAFT_191175 [Pisolithus microcarpus 441]
MSLPMKGTVVLNVTADNNWLVTFSLSTATVIDPWEVETNVESFVRWSSILVYCDWLGVSA